MAEGGRVLLLGATGFLGRHVHRALESHGHAVLAVSREPRPGAPTWRSVDLATADLRALLDEALPDVVVNCAGATGTEVTDLVTGNVLVVARLLEALADQQADLVHIGSAAEYGHGRDEVPIREQDATQPVAAYGVTKLAGTRLVATSRVRGTVLRVFNPVGAGMGLETMLGRAASAMSAAMSRGDDEITLGDLSPRRDFLGADDVGEAVVAAIVALSAGNCPRIMNIGSGRATRARDLVAALARIAGYAGALHEVAETSPRSGGIAHVRADISLATSRLGWKPSQDLEQALLGLWESFSSPAPTHAP